MANPVIDYTYFQTPPVAIPNIALTPGPYLARKEELDRYILIYEKKYLREMLGDTLYDLFVAGPAVERFVTMMAQLRDTDNKISPIANYVYVRYMQDTQKVTTSSGDKETQSPGMINQVNSQKYSSIINDMITMSEDLYDWISDNASDYPEWECAFKFERSYLFGI